MATIFAHCDGNSFYCSCERAFAPRLLGLPVVVLSNNDGCVIARTEEAKALGIPMGAPEFKWRAFFKQHHVEVFSSNYELYGDMSRRMMQTIGMHAAAIEEYSIDELFVSLEGMAWSQTEAHAHFLRDTVLQWTSLPIGVGVARTKLLAKLANRAAKKMGGVCVLDHDSHAGRDLIDRWSVQDLWGVAGRLARRLAKLGIHTAGNLRRAPRALIRQQFGVVGERMVLELNGVSCLELEEVEPPRKNICSSRSFGRPVDDLEELHQAVATYATRAAEKLRERRRAATAVCVFLQTNRHRPELPQHNPMATRPLLEPTSFTPEIIGECQKLMRAMYRPGYRYIKAGVMCLDLVRDTERQTSLFRHVDPAREAKEKALMEAADKLNLYHGRGTIRPASTGIEQPWQMRRGRLSPCYTTRRQDAPKVKI